MQLLTHLLKIFSSSQFCIGQKSKQNLSLLQEVEKCKINRTKFACKTNYEYIIYYIYNIIYIIYIILYILNSLNFCIIFDLHFLLITRHKIPIQSSLAAVKRDKSYLKLFIAVKTYFRFYNHTSINSSLSVLNFKRGLLIL